MPRPRAFCVVFVAATVLATACGLSVVGTAPVTSDAGHDAAPGSGPTRSPGDAGPVDAARSTALDDGGDGGHLLLRWNIGGPDYAGAPSAPGPWLAGTASVGPCGGSTYANSDPIQGTEADTLFQTELFGNPLRCSLGAGALLPGTYRVRMLFAEIYFGRGCPVDAGPGSRVFDIELEGASYEKGLDVQALVGCAASTTPSDAGTLTREFLVPVTDGSLDISMPAAKNNAKLSALEVEGPL